MTMMMMMTWTYNQFFRTCVVNWHDKAANIWGFFHLFRRIRRRTGWESLNPITSFFQKNKTVSFKSLYVTAVRLAFWVHLDASIRIINAGCMKVTEVWVTGEIISRQVSYGDCLEVKREYYQNCFIYCQRATSSMGTVNKNSSHSPVGPWVCLFMLL